MPALLFLYFHIVDNTFCVGVFQWYLWHTAAQYRSSRLPQLLQMQSKTVKKFCFKKVYKPDLKV